jgi:hypothetical protein
VAFVFLIASSTNAWQARCMRLAQPRSLIQPSSIRFLARATAMS